MGTNKGPLIGSEQQIKATKANSIGRTVYRFLLQVNPPRLPTFPPPPTFSLCVLLHVWCSVPITHKSILPNVAEFETLQSFNIYRIYFGFTFISPPLCHHLSLNLVLLLLLLLNLMALWHGSSFNFISPGFKFSHRLKSHRKGRREEKSFSHWIFTA